MKCIYPQVKERNFHGQAYLYQYPCGYCKHCQITKRRQWQCRILLESKLYPESIFVTLTYSQENLPEGNELQPDDLKNFIRRYTYNVGPTRYFACGEYGEKSGRAHYHAILFGRSMLDEKQVIDSRQLGHSTTAPITPHRAQYVAKYTTKHSKLLKDLPDGHQKEFARMSRNPGIGYGYVRKVADRLKRKGLSIIYSPSDVQKGSRTQITLPGSIRVDGKLLPLDSYCKRILMSELGEPDRLSRQWFKDQHDAVMFGTQAEGVPLFQKVMLEVDKDLMSQHVARKTTRNKGVI